MKYGSPWLGQVPLVSEPSRPGVEVNGGRLYFEGREWWFALNPEAVHVIARFLYPKTFSPIIRASIQWCNPTPPILPSLGGFLHPESGEYCQIDLPERWQDAWTWRDAAEWDEERKAYVAYDPVGTPPYWGEWGVVGKGGEILDCGKVGPFDTIDEAFSAAAEAASEHGATALPGDGWAQVKDSKGKSKGPIT